MRYFLALFFCALSCCYARGPGGGRFPGGGCGGGQDCKPWAFPTFNLTAKNELTDEPFMSFITLDIHNEAPLIRYMERACQLNSVGFSSFTGTYFPTLGYIINAINGVSGNLDEELTHWRVSNADGPLDQGVSSYIPKAGDDIVFEFIRSTQSA